MREIVSGLMTGLLFGLGLCLSGMTNPAIVKRFLEIAGDWNPALIFVMAGGVAVTFLGYRFLVPKSRPLWAAGFSLPTATAIDAPLLGRRGDLRHRLGAGRLLPGPGGGVARFGPVRRVRCRCGNAGRHDSGAMDAERRLGYDEEPAWGQSPGRENA